MTEEKHKIEKKTQKSETWLQKETRLKKKKIQARAMKRYMNKLKENSKIDERYFGSSVDN